MGLIGFIRLIDPLVMMIEWVALETKDLLPNASSPEIIRDAP